MIDKDISVLTPFERQRIVEMFDEEMLVVKSLISTLTMQNKAMFCFEKLEKLYNSYREVLTIEQIDEFKQLKEKIKETNDLLP